MTALRFDDQVIAITGAGNGIGRQYALEFARRGAAVVVNDLGSSPDGSGGSSSAAEAVVHEIEAAGGQAVASFDSVATEEGGEHVVAAAIERWGRLDGVVCNAGILRDRSAAKLTAEEIHSVLDVHLMGSFHVALPAFRHMRGAGRGRIVLTTSGSGLYGNFGQANYAAAKMGVVGLTRVLHIEGLAHGITANAIAPVASTRLTRGEQGDDDPRAAWKVAPLVTALCHESNDVSGEIFLVGGGVIARTWMALGHGWMAPDDELTAENVVANWSKIRDTSVSTIPEDARATGTWLTERLSQEGPQTAAPAG